ncbi:MAG: polymorphic toxin-type HINT domain-containing protein [Nevskia sp.]|nr:polymorphic toxin-type HINT domain-containing protein [Nevskia sp.]
MSNPDGGFIAGTLVHTKDGLMPIEKIRVGDWVLAQPEMKGERAYKRVVKTPFCDNREIYLFRFFRMNGKNADIDEVGVSGEHPFWIKNSAWFAAKVFRDGGDTIELHDGSDAKVLCSRYVYKSAPVEKGIGWASDLWGTDLEDGSGHKLDFRNATIRIEEEFSYLYDYARDENGRAIQTPLGDIVNPEYRTRVYNVEVEDFHTYYVGRLGAWVHNVGCHVD